MIVLTGMWGWLLHRWFGFYWTLGLLWVATHLKGSVSDAFFAAITVRLALCLLGQSSAPSGPQLLHGRGGGPVGCRVFGNGVMLLGCLAVLRSVLFLLGCIDGLCISLALRPRGWHVGEPSIALLRLTGTTGGLRPLCGHAAL